MQIAGEAVEPAARSRPGEQTPPPAQMEEENAHLLGQGFDVGHRIVCTVHRR